MRLKGRVVLEERPNPDGTPDDTVLYVDGICVAHLEQMDSGHWWLAFYHGKGDTHVNLHSTRRIHARSETTQ